MDKAPNALASLGARLPLRTAPLIFGLRNSDKTTENLWGVGVAREGNAYIYCGYHHSFDDDHWHGTLKRALRRVGHNEVSLAPPQLMFRLPGQCLWLSWPEHHASDAALACYSVYLPKSQWSVRLTDAERTRRARKIAALREPHVLVDGTRSEGEEMVVSLLRLKGRGSVDRIEGRPVSTIGILPTNASFYIHVTVRLDTEERWREIIDRMNALAVDEPPADCSEERKDVLFATMGNDEVGYATIVREPASVAVRKSDIATASDDPPR